MHLNPFLGSAGEHFQNWDVLEMARRFLRVHAQAQAIVCPSGVGKENNDR